MKFDIEMQAVIGHLAQVDLKPALREGLEKLIHDLQALADKYQTEIMQIENDPRYTSEGKKLLKREVGNNLMEQLENYDSPYSEHIAQAERRLFKGDNQEKQSDMAKVVDYLRQSELRRMYGIEKMDALEIEAHADDPQFLEAIITSPKPLLPQDKIDKLIRQKAQGASPEIAAELNQLNFCNKTVNGLVHTITQNAFSDGWRDPEDILNQEAA